MKRLLPLAVVGAVLLAATGCGGPDALVREFVVNLNGYAETIEKKESRERQAAALERIKTTIEKLDKLKLSKEEQDKLLAKHEGELRRAKERVEAAQKAAALEGGGAADAPDLFGGSKK